MLNPYIYLPLHAPLTFSITFFWISLSIHLDPSCLKPCKLSQHEFRVLKASGSNRACLMTSLTFTCYSPAYRHLFQLLPQPSASNSNPVPQTSANDSLYISPPSSPPFWGLCHLPWQEVRQYSQLFLLTIHWPCPQFLHYFLCWPYWLCFKLSIYFLHRWGPETDPLSCHFSWLLSSVHHWRPTDYNLPWSQVKCRYGNTSQ